VLDAVAERDGITVSDDDVTAEIAALAAREGQAPERVRAFYDRPEMRAALRASLQRRRTMDRIVAHARIVPAPPGDVVAPDNRSR
jgi:FKBP-type peptidyl-prolyl cis-trans isomerase (trigger factor)